MLKKIRHGVFETNSSSCHSMITSSTDVMDTTYESFRINRQKALQLEGGEYGWGYDTLTTSAEKANYLATYLMLYKSSETAWIELFESVLKETLGVTEIIYNFMNADMDSDSAYIDHESLGHFDVVFKDTETLKDFIFNTKYGIEINNDNH